MNTNYLTNLVRVLAGRRSLKPLVVSYCLTTQCNLNCRYCEDFGARRNASNDLRPLPLPQAQQLLGIIRQAADSLIVTGGEPLLYPQVEALLEHARRALRFRGVTLLTNGSLLAQHLGVLPHLTRLVISLDSVDPAAWDQVIRAAPGTAQTILDTIDRAARNARRLPLAVHCVITPDTLPQARQVLNFCAERGILFSFSPQSVNNWPHYDLIVSQDYQSFVAEVLRRKRQGAHILGSAAYLRLMASFEPFACYPMLVPRVMPDGRLAFPCRPIERSGSAHGGRAVSLLETGNWDRAMQQNVDLYGVPPSTCGSCYQQCYVEPSLMQTRPLDFLREMVTFPAARRAAIHTYAPG